MIYKNTIKRIKSLNQKKHRQKQHQFLVEGDKMVLELFHTSLQVEELLATADFLDKHTHEIRKAKLIVEVSSSEIKKASLLKNPQNSLAVCTLPPENELPASLSGLSLYLDGIQDPGNLGTILRTCDWFGINYLFCSPDTADIYNPKVIQASMGSFCRVHTVYVQLEELAHVAQEANIPVIGTYMQGRNIYSDSLPAEVVVVLGNEGQGIRKSSERYIESQLTIPRCRKETATPESLNAAVSAGIICSEFKRVSLGAVHSK